MRRGALVLVALLSATVRATLCPGPPPSKTPVEPLPPCNATRSLVLYRHVNLAGFRDRMTAYEFLARLSACLCARLLMPRLCEMLTASHNNRRRVHCHLKWSFFTAITAPAPGEAVLVEDPAFSVDQWARQSPDPPVQIHSDDCGTVWTGFKAAARARRAGARFVWRVDLLFWDFRRLFPKFPGPQPPRECAAAAAGVRKRYAEPMERLAARFLADEALTGRPYAALHLRRTDRNGACDTGLRSVERYVKCATRGGAANMTLVLFTDEKRPDYLQSVTRVLRRYFARVINGETRLRRTCEAHAFAAYRAAGNYLVFAVVRSVLFRADMALQMNLQSCGRAWCERPGNGPEW